jgi:hypothetical protein
MSLLSEDLATMAAEVAKAQARAAGGAGYDDSEVSTLIAVIGLLARKAQKLEGRERYWRHQVAVPLPPGVTDMLARRVAGGSR